MDLFREVCGRDLEGIVAKWKRGAYVSGDVTSWVKIKNPAYSQGVGRWEHFQRNAIPVPMPIDRQQANRE